MSEVMGNLLTLIIILSLVIIVYCKVTDKTIGEIISDLKENTVEQVEEVAIR